MLRQGRGDGDWRQDAARAGVADPSLTEAVLGDPHDLLRSAARELGWFGERGLRAADASDADRNAGLVMGFMPIGLAWHTFISFAAGAVWLNGDVP